VKASPNQGVAKVKYHYGKAITVWFPDTHGQERPWRERRRGRPQVPMIRGSDEEKRKVASRP